MSIPGTGWACEDYSHPDVALAGFISTAFLGVIPLEPGFRKFKFEPNPYAKLKWAEGRVPTPFGPIDARWERRGRASGTSSPSRRERHASFATFPTAPARTTSDPLFPRVAVVRAEHETLLQRMVGAVDQSECVAAEEVVCAGRGIEQLMKNLAPGWEGFSTLYANARHDLPVLPTVGEAVAWANDLVAKIDAAK